MTVASEDIAGEVLRVARERNVSVIVIGKSVRSLWSRLIRPSVAATLLDRGDSFDILVMSGGETKAPPRDDTRKAPPPLFAKINWKAYAEATAVVGITTGVAWAVSYIGNLPTLSLIYLMGVMLIAIDRGFRVSLYTSFISFLSFDFFFTPPRFSLRIERFQDFLTLTFFLFVSVVAGVIGDRLQKQIEVTRRNAYRTQAHVSFFCSRRANGSKSRAFFRTTPGSIPLPARQWTGPGGMAGRPASIRIPCRAPIFMAFPCARATIQPAFSPSGWKKKAAFRPTRKPSSRALPIFRRSPSSARGW
jgi:two-component system sensor histidine kinase KdpD